MMCSGGQGCGQKWSGVWSGFILFVTYMYALLKQCLTETFGKVVRGVRVQITLSRMCERARVCVTLLVYQTIIKSALTTLTKPLLAGGFTLTKTLTAFGHPDHRGECNMNAILQKLERKYQEASPVVVPGPFWADDENRGRGEGQGKGDGVKPMTEKVRPESWKESESVSLLSAFLTEYALQGFYLRQDGAGCPVLHMEPGVSPEDPERWDLLLHAEHLMAEALTDLAYLLEAGALTLKMDSGL